MTSELEGAAPSVTGSARPGSARPVGSDGPPDRLSGEAIAGRRDEVVLATKFAAKINDRNDGIAIDGRPEYVAAACDASLQRLGVDAIDLYYYARSG